jgi:hypothetical protein
VIGKIYVKTLDCKLFHHGQKFKLLTFFVVSRRGQLGIAAFRHILQDPRTQKIPLILETPGFKSEGVRGKEIGLLQALTSTPSATQSEEDLQSLVDELRSAIEEGKLRIESSRLLALENRKRKRKRMKVVKSKSKSTELTDKVGLMDDPGDPTTSPEVTFP